MDKLVRGTQRPRDALMFPRGRFVQACVCLSEDGTPDTCCAADYTEQREGNKRVNKVQVALERHMCVVPVSLNCIIIAINK